MSSSFQPLPLLTFGAFLCTFVGFYSEYRNMDALLLQTGLALAVGLLGRILMRFINIQGGYRRLLLPLVAATLVSLGLLIPIWRYQNHTTQRRAQLLITALEQYRRQRGNYPAQLTQLVPKQLGQLPTTALGIFHPPAYYYSLYTSDEEPSRFRAYYQLTYFTSPRIRWQYSSSTGQWDVENEDD